MDIPIFRRFTLPALGVAVIPGLGVAVLAYSNGRSLVTAVVAATATTAVGLWAGATES